MWDYDKLFAEGNVVGLKNNQENKIYPSTVYGKEYWEAAGYVNWKNYYNDSLSFADEELGYNFEIVYIIRLDEKGNMIEKLFDREKDKSKPMPKLETGMFVWISDSGMGIVDVENNRVVYQNGDYDYIEDNEFFYGIVSKITKVYSKEACCFRYCNKSNLIWKKSDSNK